MTPLNSVHCSVVKFVHRLPMIDSDRDERFLHAEWELTELRKCRPQRHEGRMSLLSRALTRLKAQRRRRLTADTTLQHKSKTRNGYHSKVGQYGYQNIKLREHTFTPQSITERKHSVGLYRFNVYPEIAAQCKLQRTAEERKATEEVE